jgi:hypothetical protein
VTALVAEPLPRREDRTAFTAGYIHWRCCRCVSGPGRKLLQSWDRRLWNRLAAASAKALARDQLFSAPLAISHFQPLWLLHSSSRGWPHCLHTHCFEGKGAAGRNRRFPPAASASSIPRQPLCHP